MTHKKVTLNVVREKTGVNHHVVLTSCSEELYNDLLLYHKTKDKTLEDDINFKLNEIEPELQVNNIIAIAGDKYGKPAFDNIILRKAIPHTYIHFEGSKKPSYYCYAGFDCSKLHANDIMHEDSSSAINCAMSLLGNVNFVMVYSVPTTLPRWVIPTEKLISGADFVKLKKKQHV